MLDKRRASKQVAILYAGDHDASGRDIERELQQRIQEYMLHGFNEADRSEDYVRELCRIEMRRIAIHKADIKRYRLPPQRVKDSDPRAKSFVREHGVDTVELDALNPNVLRDRLDVGLIH